MPKPKKDPRPTPRTTAVIDGLIDINARFGNTCPAQSVLLPNGKLVWLVTNADDVAAGRQQHEFVDVLVPLTDTINIHTMLNEVRRLAETVRDLSTKDVYAAQAAAGEPAPVPSMEFKDIGVTAAALRDAVPPATSSHDELRENALVDFVILAERDPDDIGARYAYDSALEWVARMIETGYPQPGDKADIRALVMTIRAGKKHPEITDPATYQESWEEANERDERYQHTHHTPYNVRIPNRGEYSVTMRTSYAGGIFRYDVSPTHAAHVTLNVVYDPSSTFREHVACVSCSGDDCAHADAVRALRLAQAANIADRASGD